MSHKTTNLLGAVGLAVSDRLDDAARDILNRSGETPAALVIIGHGTNPSNEQLRAVLGLSHPGSVRLVDRLVTDGLVEKHKAGDKRAIALRLTARGKRVRARLLRERHAALGPLLSTLTVSEKQQLCALLGKILKAPDPDLAERQRRCRLCDRNACSDCPIPA